MSTYLDRVLRWPENERMLWYERAGSFLSDGVSAWKADKDAYEALVTPELRRRERKEAA